MGTHHIEATEDGVHWTTGVTPDGEFVDRNHFEAVDIGTLFECSCSEEFDSRAESVEHLRSIRSGETSKQVRMLSLNNLFYSF